MPVLITVLLFLLKALGIFLLAALAILLLALVIPVSLWLDYHEEDITVQVGALGLKYTLLPQKEKPEKKPREKDVKKTKAKTKAAKQPKAAAAKEPSKEATVKQPKPADAKQPQPQPQGKGALLGLTFDQLVTTVKGLGTMGKRIVNGLKVRHIRLYLPVTGEDAADTAMQYGRMQAWLHAGLGVLNRAVWLDFDEFRLEADFLAKGEKKSRFSCQISARLLIMGIAVARFGWLLWKANILPVLLDQFAGKEKISKENNDG